MAVNIKGEPMNALEIVKAITRGIEFSERGVLAACGVKSATYLSDGNNSGVKLEIADRPYSGSIWIIATENAGHFTVAFGEVIDGEWKGREKYFEIPAEQLALVVRREVFGADMTPVEKIISPLVILSHP